MKLLLMRPPSDIKKMIPMGLMYVAGYLRKAVPDLDVRILDLRHTTASQEAISRRIGEYSPDIVGISAVNMEAHQAHTLARIVRDTNKAVQIIVGGPYATSLSHRIVQDKNVLCAVIGEGEETLCELVMRIREGADVRDTKGIAFVNGNGCVKTPPREPIQDLDSIPFPSYELVDLQDYFRSSGTHSGLQARREYVSIFTSRGCPFHCIYCHNIFGKKIRFRSAEHVFQEISLLCHDCGVREIHIEDDSFNVNRDRAKDIFSRIVSANMDLKIAFPNGIRADLVDEELLDLFAQAGVYRLAYGLETGSLQMQRRIRKNLDLDVARKSIEMTSRRGISAHGFFMLGFLGETKEEMLQTIDYAAKSSLHTASFSFVVPQPGTQLYDEAVAAGHTFEGVDPGQLNPGDTEINISGVSAKDLHHLRRKAYRKFYFNVRRIFGIWRTTPRKLVLVKSFLSFLTNMSPISVRMRERLQGVLWR